MGMASEVAGGLIAAEISDVEEIGGSEEVSFNCITVSVSPLIFSFVAANSEMMIDLRSSRALFSKYIESSSLASLTGGWSLCSVSAPSVTVTAAATLADRPKFMSFGSHLTLASISFSIRTSVPSTSIFGAFSESESILMLFDESTRGDPVGCVTGSAIISNDIGERIASASSAERFVDP